MAEGGAARDEFAEVLAAQLGALQERLLAEHARALRPSTDPAQAGADGAAMRQELDELRAENAKLHSELLTLAGELREDVKLLADKMANDPELQAAAFAPEPRSAVLPGGREEAAAEPQEPPPYSERLRLAARAAQQALEAAEEALVFSMPGVHLFPGGMGFTGTDVSPGSIERLPTQGAPYTVEAWIRPHHDPGVSAVVGWGDWGVENKTQCLLLHNSEEVEDTWWGSAIQASLKASLADGKFHHVATTWDGTTRKLFVDFEEVASTAAAPNAVTSTETLCIGQAGWDEAGVTVCPFKGALKDVRIWTIAWSAAELRARAGAAGS